MFKQKALRHTNMKMNITGKNITVTPGIRTKIEKQFAKFEKYDVVQDDTECRVVVRTVKEDQIIEVTMFLPHKNIVRIERRDQDLYAAIDSAEAAMCEKLKKNKERDIEKHRNKKNISEIWEEKNLIRTVEKEKKIELNTMSEDDAINELEKLDHDFHLYKNEDGLVSLVYKRKDGGYGLLVEN